MLIRSRKGKAKLTPHARLSQSNDPRPTRGRPFKRASELQPAYHSRRKRARDRQNEARLTRGGNVNETDTENKGRARDRNGTSRLSALESLPVELIQQIFFESFEVSLARTSRHLAHALSKLSIYRALVLFAYFDPGDDDVPAAHVEVHHFLPARYRRIDADEKLRLQLGILPCRWCTLSILQACIPALSRLQMVLAWHQERQMHLRRHDQGRPSADPLDVSRQLPLLDDNTALARHFWARRDGVGGGPAMAEPVASRLGRPHPLGDLIATVPAGADGYLPLIVRSNVEAATTSPGPNAGQAQVVQEQVVGVMAVRAIPRHLLRGSPWTADKISVLRLLRAGARFFADDQLLRYDETGLVAGMESAIADGNDRALVVLLEMHWALCNPRRAPHEPREVPLPLALFHRACSPELEKVPWTLGGTVAPPQAPVVLFAERSRLSLAGRMISLLVRASLPSIPGDDAVLTRWATHAVADSPMPGDRHVARMVLNHMSSSRFDASPFVEGRWQLEIPFPGIEHLPFADLSFTMEMAVLFSQP